MSFPSSKKKSQSVTHSILPSNMYPPRHYNQASISPYQMNSPFSASSTHKTPKKNIQSLKLDLHIIHQASNAGYQSQILNPHNSLTPDLRDLPDQWTSITLQYRKDLHESTTVTDPTILDFIERNKLPSCLIAAFQQDLQKHPEKEEEEDFLEAKRDQKRQVKTNVPCL